MIKDIIYDRPQLVQQLLESLLRQLEQTTQVAEENIPFENVVDLNDKIFNDGEIIIKEGTEGTEIFRLLKSQHGLKVTICGKELGTITKPGEYFGEMSAILKEKRSATVTSIGRSIVQVFSSDNIESILESYPHLSKKIIDALAKRLYESNKKLSDKNPVDFL
jgi:type IV pilus assembly protein PilB